MTIKIITRGADPKKTILECACNNCKTIFECEKSDAKYEGNYDCRDPRESPYYTVSCPVCNRGVYVKDAIKHWGMY